MDEEETNTGIKEKRKNDRAAYTCYVAPPMPSIRTKVPS